MNNFNVVDNNLQVYHVLEDSTFNVAPRLNAQLLFANYQGSKLDITVNDNSTLKVVYFTNCYDDNHFKIQVLENTTLYVDVILLNGNTDFNLEIDVDGSNAFVDVKTLSLAKNNEKNINIKINHNAIESKSSVTNYGISFENGTNRFTTIGKIHKNMKNSDVRQITRGLLLSPTGVCLAEPILLIDYYDVKAYHGATIGKISDDDLFYLMSRGLSKEEAFMLIINGLVEPFLKDILDEELRGAVMDIYEEYFRG